MQQWGNKQARDGFMANGSSHYLPGNTHITTFTYSIVFYPTLRVNLTSVLCICSDSIKIVLIMNSSKEPMLWLFRASLY